METPASLNDLQRTTLAIVLAGGRGTRLGPLTNKRVKPAVHFGGKYRIIDFALSNCLNSGIRRIAVVTQYKAHSLLRHLQRGWGFLRGEFNEFLDLWPAQQRVEGAHWYRGTADAVYQNIDIIRSISPKYVVVLAGDHIYKMDYTRMVADHAASGADCTVGCIEVPRMEARAFGVMAVDESRRVTGFVEKPDDPPAMPGHPDIALASMGIYVFDTEYLIHLLEENIARSGTDHDFGKDIIPRVVSDGHAIAHPFSMSCVSSDPSAEPYWRDVGTIDAYWSANLDLASTIPALDLYDRHWPIWTYMEQLPPAKFVRDLNGLQGSGTNLIVCGGSVISGSQISRSVLSTNVVVKSFCNIAEAVLLPQVVVGASCRLRKVVVDRGCVIPDGLVIGEDPQRDGERFYRTENGIVLVTREALANLGPGA
ncbi:glucose-1-phosphate adenylyltransferase [Burkholderia sp. Ax-1719]|uniref:glucose-1-phosphate adenylyltransferase n=1 Tax=Burkholderia sp. Ax-1719 TaxID=2608334 RepID=UPI00141FCAFE|nr:glucose-1-phosphate adenylyltransferase [Burkholderia sp. Ax-1719]NIE65061.1 glucose-1-phosphate adenylyltransferase [Burkholderia sp. Ax-1719]